jgi:endonuclease/exonuclease/phosphatase family metal-dependent hydrolase
MPSHDMTPKLGPGRTCPGSGGPTWYFPEEAADNAHLEDWCVTVGPPVVRLVPGGSFSAAGGGPSSDLTVWSWNVAAGGGDLRRFLAEEAGLRCAGPESSLGADGTHFALLVQEAFRRSPDVPESTDESVIPRAAAEQARPGGRPDIVEVAEECGLSLVYVAASRNGDRTTEGLREDRGMAILSTLPLSDPWFIELPYEAARRVAVGATVGGEPARTLRLVNVHLTSTPAPARVLTTGNGSRLRQGLAVADAVHQREEADLEGADAAGTVPSILLAGDFNTWSDSETTLLRLRELFPDSPPALDPPTRGDFPTDHILFRAGRGDAALIEDSTYGRVEERFYSDHHPVAVRIRFTRDDLAPPPSPY